MRLKSILSACVLAAASAAGTQLRAQSLEPFNPYGIFSPSVEAWQMTRYGNLTPSLYTGAMTFSLPLYTYEDPDFTIPISLEYSFDGYRPAQHSGTVGYGWYLNCGGVITREVRGLPDEGDLDGNRDYQCLVRGWRQTPASVRDSIVYKSGKIYSAHRIQLGYVPEDQCQGLLTSYNTFSDIPGLAPGATVAMGAAVIYDTAPDIYRFNFLGHSGEFMMLPDGTVCVYNSDLPPGELSVSFTDNASNPAHVDITISSGDGFTYTFSTGGVNLAPNITSSMAFRASRSVNEYVLSGITAPNGRTADFSYASNPSFGISRSYGTEGDVQYLVQTLHDYGDGGTSSGTSDIQNPVPWTVIQEYSTSLTAIAISGAGSGTGTAARILFSYGTAPANEFAPACFSQSMLAGEYGNASSTRLRGIAVENADGETVEAFSLSQHCAASGTPKMFLDSVESLTGGTHAFSYNLSGYTLPSNDTQATDHWGFWNGSTVSDLRDHLTQCTDITLVPAHDEYINDVDSTFVVHVPAQTVKGTSHHLYDQTIDSAKEASFHYASCGALCRITYPAGGTTDIEYEPNSVRRRLNRHTGNAAVTLEPADSSDTSATWTVGGVRVKSLADNDASGTVRTSSFSYTDSQGRASGILMQMPRYCERSQYIHRVNSTFASNDVQAVALTTITAFSNALFPLNTDAHVAYPHVCVTHPDGSSTRHEFASVEQPALMDGRSSGSTVIKRTMCDHDWIETTDGGHPDSYLVPVTVDRRCMRGKPLAETTSDAAGSVLHSASFTYGSYTAVIPAMCYNNTTCYNLASYTVVCPLLVSSTETLYGVTTRTDYDYNGRGQVQGVTTASVSAALYNGYDPLQEMQRIRYRFLWETAPGTPFPALKDAAVKTAVRDNLEYITAAESYSYTGTANPAPTGITQRSVGADPPSVAAGTARNTVFSTALSSGTARTTYFSYNPTSFRLLSASLPGGATLTYTWNGNNISSKTENGGPATLYSWKDLVGPTLITAPSGASEGYGYDSHCRLHRILDPDGRTVSTYNYQLVNE